MVMWADGTTVSKNQDVKVHPNLRSFLTEEDAEEIEGKQAMKIDEQENENGVGTEAEAAEGQGSTENEQATFKERRKRLKERKKALEQTRDSYDDTAEEWKSINALVQDMTSKSNSLRGHHSSRSQRQCT